MMGVRDLSGPVTAQVTDANETTVTVRVAVPMRAWRWWRERNGYVTTRIEYALNKAAHSLLIGTAIWCVIPPALFSVCVLVATLGYWLAGFTPLGDKQHPTTPMHALAKLYWGLLAPVVAFGNPTGLFYWLLGVIPLLIWEL